MARARNKLTARSAAALVNPGRHSDGGNLYLEIDDEGRRRWIFHVNKTGKRRVMGLGGFPAVSLADARKARDDAERMVRQGLDPIEARNSARQEQTTKPTFGEVAEALIESKGAAWRSAKHRAQWTQTLSIYAAPLRSMSVDQIDTAAVLSVLTPIWQAKPVTAARLRGRIEAVLDAAKAKGYRSGENPARWRGHLDHLLSARQKLTRGHHAAMPYGDVPAFMAELRQREGIVMRALEFTILTAARAGEAYGARWSEIDMNTKVWTVAAARMKAAKEHRIPLSPRALVILEELAKARTGDFVFPSPRGNHQLSHVAMWKVIKRLGVTGVTAHGFRSAFRDWAGNETHFPREVAEAALAHVVGNAVELAYRRSDALEKRRALMDAWAAYCEPKDKGGADVLPFRNQASA